MGNKRITWKYPEAIVTCQWLKDRLLTEKIRIFDCTTFLHYTDNHPNKPYVIESGFENYKKGHIPGAAFINLQEQLSNNNSKFSFTIPDYDILDNNLKELGVGDPFHIILYSTNAIQWATRVWWLIYILGYKKVSILDGGLYGWQRLGYDLESGENFYKSAKFKTNLDKNVFVDKEHTLKSINDKKCILINALTKEIHNGESVRYGRPGRIPKSVNIPVNELVKKDTQELLAPEEALALFDKENIQKDRRVLNYCGGGIAATLNAFILRQLGIENLEIYDNSLSEWAMDNELPIEVNN